MNYEEQDYEEIFTEVLEDSVNVGLISKADNFLSLVENRQDISNYNIILNFIFISFNIYD